MAIINLGTLNKLPAIQIPENYVLPVVASFSDFEYKRTLTLSVLKATVETATPEATMGAILDNATIGINKQVADIVAADFLATAAVTTFAELQGLKTNIDETTYLKNTPTAYVCTVVLYTKVN